MDQNNPYDFIVNPQGNHPKRGVNFNSGGKNKIVVFAIFGLGVIIVLVVGFSILTSLGKTNNQDLISVETEQTELLRIIGLGKKDATDSALVNRLSSLETLVTSDKTKVAKLLSDRGVEVAKEILSSEKDSQVDTDLDKAKQNGNYDDVLLDKVSERSNSYYSALKTALSDAKTKTEKELLNTSISNLEATANN
jgi:hypothetical protein